jgi:uncharacterized membrane protein YfcA
MKDQMDKGQEIVLAIIGATIGFSAFSVITFILFVKLQWLPFQVVRLILTILLGVFLYRGIRWVYWLSVILYGLGGVIGIASGFLFFGKIPLTLVSVIMGVVYILSAWALYYSKNVRAFLTEQRRPYKGNAAV